MQADRYAPIADSLRRMGWLQDRLLHRARTKAVEAVVQAGARTVLDACCGAGTLSRYLDAAGLRVTGVDASPAMLNLAQRQASGVRWIQADVTRLELSEPVDAAVIALTLHEMPEAQRQAVWRALQGLTRPDGVCVVVDYTIPPRATLAARMADWVIRQDERALDRDDPGHYANYLDFLSRGGARGWLAGTGAHIMDEAYYLFGNLGVFRLARISHRSDTG
ncbi:hypothetical protein B1C78_16050 [Thioalkalivibrio denitrificans]|uniref:Methyltransferase domain-containing protein n=1 Tax=Thioalkalivibrio denitrificans TaxID=108003 RepID=A0A1V3N9J3_9GAMM|nr:class I SAM-dependent methyltransferase [Thioalkalivibrio denitrificans]OOG21476.1 hypothetical protein B1C78_16050 [Thioalkalivibrio denitrificans]